MTVKERYIVRKERSVDYHRSESEMNASALVSLLRRIPEFTQLWKDILHNPEVLAPGFKGLCIHRYSVPHPPYLLD